MVDYSNEYNVSSFFDTLFSKTFKTNNTEKETTSTEKNDDMELEESIYYRHPSPIFRRYELITEFMTYCPSGLYIMPCSDTLNVWYGVLFIYRGSYTSGVFKFRIIVPENYPYNAPTVGFLTDIFHPLVDHQGYLSLGQQFPSWRPHQDYIIHLLIYIKNIFKKDILDQLIEKHCLNKEAYRLYREDQAVFNKLAQQSARLSITESYLYDHFPNNNLIRFAPMDEQVFDTLKSCIQNTME
ncbi:unnamed protein product [Cunninghamella echinulata]